jgi:hypothetical protein
MSSSLSLGGVTAVLRRVLEESIKLHDLKTVLNGAVEVSTLPPDRLKVGKGDPDRINLFLLQVSENAAWRNADFPSRNGSGDRRTNPKLALDLIYLVTAYGAAEFHAEMLLGHAMFVFHETPVLTRQSIREALLSLPAGLDKDNMNAALRAALLEEQIEQIKIVPRVLTVEEISKIWGALQSQYRTTAAYHVSVVLIEAAQPARTALPVLTRGRPVPGTNRDEGVFVQANLLPAVPTLQELIPQTSPAIRMGEKLTLQGHHLGGTVVRARFRLLRGDYEFELPAQAGASDTGFDVQMPAGPDDRPAGVYEVSAVLTQGGVERTSNRLPVMLAPLITVGPVVGGALTITCNPRVGPRQHVVLVVGTRELLPTAASFPLVALPAPPHPGPTATLNFILPTAPHALPSGSQWVRLRVDGMESILVDRTKTPPEFVPSQVVVLP